MVYTIPDTINDFDKDEVLPGTEVLLSARSHDKVSVEIDERDEDTDAASEAPVRAVGDSGYEGAVNGYV